MINWPREHEAIVGQNKHLNKKLASEQIAEFDYLPANVTAPIAWASCIWKFN